jgi:hypothetical protein
VNVIDDVAGSFSFPRFPLLIREAAPPTPDKAASSPAGKNLPE